MSSDIRLQTERTLMRHLAAFASRNIDSILADYTEETMIVLPDQEIQGLDNVREFFTTLLNDYLPLGSTFELKKNFIHENVACLMWSGKSEKYNFPFATDTIVFKDDKIHIQTIGYILEETG